MTFNRFQGARGVLELARTGDPRDIILAGLVEGQRSLVEGQRSAEARLKMLEPLTVAPRGFVRNLTERNPRTAVDPAVYQIISERPKSGLRNFSAAAAKSAPPEEEDES